MHFRHIVETEIYKENMKQLNEESKFEVNSNGEKEAVRRIKEVFSKRLVKEIVKAAEERANKILGRNYNIFDVGNKIEVDLIYLFGGSYEPKAEYFVFCKTLDKEEGEEDYCVVRVDVSFSSGKGKINKSDIDKFPGF